MPNPTVRRNGGQFLIGWLDQALPSAAPADDICRMPLGRAPTSLHAHMMAIQPPRVTSVVLLVLIRSTCRLAHISFSGRASFHVAPKRKNRCLRSPRESEQHVYCLRFRGPGPKCVAGLARDDSDPPMRLEKSIRVEDSQSRQLGRWRSIAGCHGRIHGGSAGFPFEQARKLARYKSKAQRLCIGADSIASSAGIAAGLACADDRLSRGGGNQGAARRHASECPT